MGCRYAVIGDPIKHSLSPQMQNAGLKALGIDGDYQAVHVKASGLEDFTDYARKELNGFNITVPHKKAIIPFLDEISEESRFAESVNTVTVKDGKLIGDSTDGYGLKTAIHEEFGIQVSGKSFCFIGCGGAVQAVSSSFAGNGASGIFFINRTLSKAEALAKKLKNSFSETVVECCAIDDTKSIKDFVNRSAVVIQGTSLGLNNNDPLPVSADLISGDICFYDTIYKDTGLLKAVRAKGLKTADGRSMLLHQGVRSLEIWTGRKGPVEAMREALYSAINSRNKGA
jgi:shikimate dehydrogenase